MATQEMIALSDCNTGFGLDLYSKLVEANPDKNIFFSPISISFALAMTYLGAKGQTMEQMKKAMKLDTIADDKLHQVFSEINKSLLDTEGKYILHIANRLYGEKSYEFLDEFLKNCQKYYGAELAAVDFVNDTERTIKLINHWVEEQTKEKIKNLIPPKGLTEDSLLVLVNAIYFKGSWLKEFDPELTKESDFHVTKEKSVKVQMMRFKEKSLGYSENDELHCQILELPYANYSLSLLIFLPDLTKITLTKLEQSLTSNLINSLFFPRNDVNVWLPRFKLEMDFELSDFLKSMGIKDMFSGGKADFSGMDGTKNLVVSKVLHKAFLEVNEKGSEAAAATGMMMVGCCAPMGPKKIYNFKADHPFLFCIRDCQTKSILFFGKLCKP